MTARACHAVILAGAAILGVGSRQLVLAQEWPLPPSFQGLLPLEHVVKDAIVREEAGLIEQQHLQAKQLLADYNAARLRTARRLLGQGLSDADASQLLQAEMDQFAESLPMRLQGILRPEQHTRLQQVVLQKTLRGLGVLLLARPPIGEVLGLTPEERDAWKEVLQREQRRWHESRQRLPADADRPSIREVLTPAQREHFEELHGELFRQGALPSLDDPRVGTSWPPEMDLLRNGDVRKEIELVEDQEAAIRDLLAMFAREAQTLELKARLDHTEHKRSTTALRQAQALLQLQETLLPHQLRRLRQIIFQIRVRERFTDPFRSPLVSEALELTASQQKELWARMDAEAKAARQAEDELWDEVLRTCIEALTPEQQAKYHRLVGKPFPHD